MSTQWPTALEWLSGERQSGDVLEAGEICGAGEAGEIGGAGETTVPGDRAAGNRLVVAGVPLREGAVTPSRYDLAPGAVRACLGRLSTFNGERNVDISSVAVTDLGDDLTPPPLDATLTMLLGGHNGVTYEALSQRDDLPSWGLLTLDAHHDVRPYPPGAPGNGSPVRALVDAGMPGTNVVQVGIAGFSNIAEHRRWCEEIGVTIRGPEAMGEVPELLEILASRCESVYVDIDIDVLDRAFAPGSPGARPGGVTPRQLFDAAYWSGAHPSVRAVDLVEVDPESDVASTTTFNAAICFLNVASGFATRQRGVARTDSVRSDR